MSSRRERRRPVLLDVQALQNPVSAERGIGRYVSELANAFEHSAGAGRAIYLLNPDRPVSERLEPLLASGRVEFSHRVTAASGCALHVPSPFEPAPIGRIWPTALRSLPLLVTVHDVIPFIFPGEYMGDARVRRWYHARLELIRQATRVVAISHATARDAVELLGARPDRVAAVPLGVPDRFRAASSGASEAEQLAKPFVLYVGGADPHKNVDLLVRAYAWMPAAVRRRHSLVVGGGLREEQRSRLERLADELGMASSLRFTGPVSDEELARLYRTASLFVFPSLYEGYGFPVVEALASGAPVLAARTGALAEHVEAHALFDPHDPEALASAMEAALTDARVRDSLVRPPRPRSWQDVVRDLEEVYAAVSERRAPPRARRTRIALVAPLWPGVPFGGANARLAHGLASICDLDVFTEVPEAGPAEGGGAYRPEFFDAVESARGGYDAVVYCLAGDGAYASSLELLRRRPGVVVAHALALADLYSWCVRERPHVEPRGLAGALHAMYGHRLPDALRDAEPVTAGACRRHGILMLAEVADACQRLLVPSAYAAQLAALDVRPADRAKVAAMPALYPAAAGDRHAGGPPLVVAAGPEAPIARPQTIVEAFSRVAGGARSPALALVGALRDADAAECARLAEARGIAPVVRIQRGADARSVRGWLRRASVAITLDGDWTGGVVASLSESLAAGAPTIAADVGPVRAAGAPVVPVAEDVREDELASLVSALLHDADRRAALAAAALAHARAGSSEAGARVVYAAALERRKQSIQSSPKRSSSRRSTATGLATPS